MRNWRRDGVGLLVTAGFVTVCYLVLHGVGIDPSMKDVALILIGQLSGKFGTVVGYHYGSSAGSSMKDQAINDLTKKGP